MEEALLGPVAQETGEGNPQVQMPKIPVIGAFGNLYPTLNITPLDTQNFIQSVNQAFNVYKPPAIQPFSLGNTIQPFNMNSSLKGIETNIGLLGKGKSGLQPLKSNSKNSNSATGDNSGSNSYESPSGYAENGASREYVDMSLTEKLYKAISSKESGGNYNAVGKPVEGDRAYGKYQVMGANIPSWSKEILGRSITAQEYLNSPELQEQIAQAKIKEYYDAGKSRGLSDDDASRYVATAWYGGPGKAAARVQGDKFVYMEGDYNKQSTDLQGGFPSIKDYGDNLMAELKKYGSAPKSSKGGGVEVIDTLKNSYAGATVIRDNSVLSALSNPTTSGRVNSPFGYRGVPGGTAAYNISSKTGQQVNVGTDFFGNIGDPALAMVGGEVTFADVTNDGGGKRVTLKFNHNGNDYFVDYNHLDSIGVGVGEKLKSGQRLGGIGASGNTTGPHADVAVYRMDGNKRQFIDTSSRFK